MKILNTFYIVAGIWLLGVIGFNDYQFRMYLDWQIISISIAVILMGLGFILFGLNIIKKNVFSNISLFLIYLTSLIVLIKTFIFPSLLHYSIENCGLNANCIGLSNPIDTFVTCAGIILGSLSILFFIIGVARSYIKTAK